MAATISVITPVFNESENIGDLCQALDTFAMGAAGKGYTLELIFVDDGSKDDSFERLKAYQFQNARAKVISLSQNCGSHIAIRAGLSMADTDYSMLFSADLQEPVELVDMLYQKISEGDGFDIVYVQKGATQVSGGESLFSRWYARMMKKHAVSSFPAGGVNNFMLTRRIRDIINATPERNSSIFLQVLSMGFRTAMVTCDYNERKKGKSKWTLSKKIKLFIDSFVSFSFFPLRMVTLLGILLFLAGIIYAVYIIIMKLVVGYAFEAGFPSLIAVLLAGFGITNLSLGIMAEYLWRTLDVSRSRPVFLIDRVVQIDQNGAREEKMGDTNG